MRNRSSYSIHHISITWQAVLACSSCCEQSGIGHFVEQLGTAAARVQCKLSSFLSWRPTNQFAVSWRDSLSRDPDAVARTFETRRCSVEPGLVPSCQSQRRFPWRITAHCCKSPTVRGKFNTILNKPGPCLKRQQLNFWIWAEKNLRLNFSSFNLASKL